MLQAAQNWKTVPLPVYKSSSVYIFICSLGYKSESFALPVSCSVYMQPRWLNMLEDNAMNHRHNLPQKSSKAECGSQHNKISQAWFLIASACSASSRAARAAKAVPATGCVEFKMQWKYLSVIISHLTLYFLSSSPRSANVLFYNQHVLSGLCCVSEVESSPRKTKRASVSTHPARKTLFLPVQHGTFLSTTRQLKKM